AIYSATTSTMIITSNSLDYYFELPCGSGAPNQFDRNLRHTMTQFRATPRANRTSKSADNPIPYATSSTAELTVCGPSLPWRWHGHAASRGAETDAARLAHLVCRLLLEKKKYFQLVLCSHHQKLL